MINKKLMASILVGAATLMSTALPTPALAKGSAAQNAALDMMAMQIYMQQQANAQNQAILAQEQAQANYNAAQAAWTAANSYPVQTVVSYAAPTPVYVAAAPIVYHVNHEFRHDFGHDFRAFRR